ncbi:MAG: hypothetical protein ACRCSU_01015 [Paracoccaceae bacterium]
MLRTFGLVSGVCVAGFLALQLYLGGKGVDLLAGLSAKDVAPTGGAAQHAATSPGVTADIVSIGGDIYLNPAAQSYVFPGVLSDERQVVLRLPVDVASLLDPAEPMPAPELAQIFAVARADRVANGECARLMRRVAAECDLARAGVEPGAEADQPLTLVLTLRFTPLRATGQLPETDQMQFVTSTLPAEPLPDGVAERVTTVETGGTYRDYLYADAEAACAQMRRSVGNCSIMRINADLTGDSADGSFTIAWMEPLHITAEDHPTKPAG